MTAAPNNWMLANNLLNFMGKEVVVAQFKVLNCDEVQPC
jgi:hypothetical protein